MMEKIEGSTAMPRRIRVETFGGRVLETRVIGYPPGGLRGAVARIWVTVVDAEGPGGDWAVAFDILTGDDPFDAALQLTCAREAAAQYEGSLVTDADAQPPAE